MTALPLVFDAPRRGSAADAIWPTSTRPAARRRWPSSDLPAFRADQLSRHYFGRFEAERRDDDRPVGRGGRDRLARRCCRPCCTTVRRLETDAGTTRKTLWRLHDGALVESVLMRYPGARRAVARADHGLRVQPGRVRDGLPVLRDRPGRPEAQPVDRPRSSTRSWRPPAPPRDGEMGGSPGRLSNVVFMGMGEPLANYPRLVAALRRLVEPSPGRARPVPAVDHRVHRRAGPGDRAARRGEARTSRWPSRCTPRTTSCATRWSRSTPAGRSPRCSPPPTPTRRAPAGATRSSTR